MTADDAGPGRPSAELPQPPREFARVRTRTTATVYVAGVEPFEHDVRDVGLGGVYVGPHPALQERVACDLEFCIQSVEGAPKVRAQGRVVRADREGVAIVFTDMPIDAFDALDRFVSLATRG